MKPCSGAQEVRERYRAEVLRIAEAIELDADGCATDEQIAEPCQASLWTGEYAGLTWYCTAHREAADDMMVDLDAGFDAVVRAAACYAMIEDVRDVIPEAKA